MFDSTEERRAMPANEGAIEVAAWLLRWCPHQARAFALAMHELAAWQYDDSRTEHWHRVLGPLRAE
jgi:hypothetical protein